MGSILDQGRGQRRLGREDLQLLLGDLLGGRQGRNGFSLWNPGQADALLQALQSYQPGATPQQPGLVNSALGGIPLALPAGLPGFDELGAYLSRGRFTGEVQDPGALGGFLQQWEGAHGGAYRPDPIRAPSAALLGAGDRNALAMARAQEFLSGTRSRAELPGLGGGAQDFSGEGSAPRGGGQGVGGGSSTGQGGAGQAPGPSLGQDAGQAPGGDQAGIGADAYALALSPGGLFGPNGARRFFYGSSSPIGGRRSSWASRTVL